MRKSILCLLMLFAAISRGARAQTCTPPAHPYFEFQVEQPAAFIGDTTLRPIPARNRFGARQDDPTALLVQFVVDTLGYPDERSFRALKVPSSGSVDSVRAALPSWRFRPARLSGCLVPQLVQTMIDR